MFISVSLPNSSWKRQILETVDFFKSPGQEVTQKPPSYDLSFSTWRLF